MSNALTERQREILETALILIAQGGAQNFTIKRLANGMDVSEAAIYRHFNSKKEILDALVARFDSDSEQVFNSVENKGLKGIEEFIKTRAERVVAKPALANVLFSEEVFADSTERSDALRAMMKRHRARLVKMFSDAKARGEVRKDVPDEHLFIFAIGSFRMLVKSWGRSNYSFDLSSKVNKLWEDFEKMTRPN